MLKMGIPLDAIKHKMICDNLDPNIIDKPSSKKEPSSTYKSVTSHKIVISPPPLIPPSINLFYEIKKAKQQKENKQSKIINNNDTNR